MKFNVMTTGSSQAPGQHFESLSELPLQTVDPESNNATVAHNVEIQILNEHFQQSESSE